MTRIESPSSISTYNSCPRKYYYSYKIDLPKKENISTITGKSVHSALENFYKIDIDKVDAKDYVRDLKQRILGLFNDAWVKNLQELIKLENEKEVIREYYERCMYMLNNFFEDYMMTLQREMEKYPLIEAFNRLKPMTEVYMFSEKHNVRGYLDVLMNYEGDVYIMDYKTSSKDEISNDYQLQLVIYALMYKEKHNKLPTKIGIHFLRHGTKKYLDVTDGLLEMAEKECQVIRVNTQSDSIADYPKNPGPFCKWRDGQCSFYDMCFGVQKLNSFIEVQEVKNN